MISELITDSDEISKLIRACFETKDSEEKGKLLERTFESIVHIDPRLQIVRKHLRTATGELDYVVRHSIGDAFWKQSPYFVAECKNWKNPIEPEQLHHFLTLVRDSGPMCILGIYVTTSHLTPASWTAIRDARLRDGIITVVIDKKTIPKLPNGLGGLIPRLYEAQAFRADDLSK